MTMQHQMAQPDELTCVKSHTINGEQDDSGANTSQTAYVTCQRLQPLPNRSTGHKFERQKTSLHLGRTAGFENGQLSLSQ